MANNITFDIIGRDRSGSDAFDKVSRSANRADGAMSRFSAGAAKVAKAGMFALGAGAVVAGKGLYEMAQSAAEDELAQRKLALTLKNTTGATDDQIASVERWITAQGKALGVADDDLRPALQRLAEGSGDVAEAQRLASIAMDASAGTGRSLKSVSEALLRAQNGAIGGLSRYGIATKDAKGETLSFEEVTRKMAQTFEGQAEKAAETTAGKFARLKLILSETGEEIGAKLIPYASDLADAFMDKGVPALERFADKAGPVFRNMVEGAGEIKDAVQPAIEEIVEALGSLTSEGKGAGRVFDNVFLPALRTTADVVAGVVDFIDDLPGPIKDIGAQAAVAAILLYKLSTAMKAVAESKIATTLSTAAGRMDVLKSAARGAAGIGGILLLTKAFQDAGDEGASFGDVMLGVAGGAGVGAMFGPIGALVGAGAGGGLMALRGAFSGTAEEAAELRREQTKTEYLAEQKRKVEDLAGSLDGLTGAYTETTRAAVFQRLETDGLIEQGAQYEISARTLVDAALGQEAATKRVTRALESTGTITHAIYGANGQIIGTYQAASSEVGEFAAELGIVSEHLTEAQRATRDAADATESLATRLGLTKKEMKGIPRDVRIAIRDDVPDKLREIKNLAGEVKGLDRKTIKILLEAANLPATAANIRAVQREIRKTDGMRAAPEFVAADRALREGLLSGQRGITDLHKREAKPTLTADDRPFVSFAKHTRDTLRDLGREKADPKVGLDLSAFHAQRQGLLVDLNNIPDETVNVYIQRRGAGQGDGTGGGADLGYGDPPRRMAATVGGFDFGSNFEIQQTRAAARSADVRSTPQQRRMVVEVRVSGDLDLDKAKAQIEGIATEVFADEFQEERRFERQQR